MTTQTNTQTNKYTPPPPKTEKKPKTNTYKTPYLSAAFWVCFFIVNVQQLWEIDPGCQHFLMIKECVNQRASKMEPSGLLLQPQSSPLLRDSCPVSRGIPWANPTNLTLVVFSKQHKSNLLLIPLWMLLLLASSICVPTAGLSRVF